MKYKSNIINAINLLEKISNLNLNFLKKIALHLNLNLPLKYMRKNYIIFIKKIENYKNKYVILCNSQKGKNIFNLPFFMSTGQFKDILKFKNKNFQKNKFCCFIVSNLSAIERISFYEKLSKYKKIDCYGKTYLSNSNNDELPNNFTENKQFFQQYKFVICFENSFAEEYITEKLPNVMLGNSIPIYRGAQNVSTYFNTKSFINYENYEKSYDKMIEKIIELDKDDEKYKKFLKQPWMTKQNKKNIENKIKNLKRFLKKIVEK
jgi:hypothetical protein